MHILMVTHYFAPDAGAAAVRLTRLATQLQAGGHDVTVLTTLPHYPQGSIAPEYRGRFSVTEWREGVRVVRAWLWATPSARISRRMASQLSFILPAFISGLRLPRPDVVLIEAQPVFTAFAGTALARVKNVPYVLNISDLWPDHLLSVGAVSEAHPAYRAARLAVDGMFRGAARIAAMSPVWADKVRGYIGTNGSVNGAYANGKSNRNGNGNGSHAQPVSMAYMPSGSGVMPYANGNGSASSDPVRVIYNGVDLRRFTPDADGASFRARHNLGDARLVSFIGTFATQYDFALMLDVAERFVGREDVRFVLIGDGSQADYVRGRAAALANVRTIGWLDHADMPGAWAATTLAWWAMRPHPLYHGTIPAKLYELAAAGVPVAAAQAGVAAQMASAMGAGILVSPGDADGLADAVARLLDDDALRAACGQAARVYAERHFDPERVTASYEAMLRSAVL